MLPQENRLKTSRDFDKVYKKGSHHKGTYGKLVALNRNDDSPTRFGIVISAKQGNAVERNRAKRQIRETFKTVLPDISSGYDVTLIMWDLSFSFKELNEDLMKLMKEAKLIT